MKGSVSVVVENGSTVVIRRLARRTRVTRGELRGKCYPGLT